MKKTVTISAKTLEEALTKGSEELGVGLADVDFAVVDEGGMFRKMQVNVSLKADATVSKEPTPAPQNSGVVEEFEIVGQAKPAKKATAEVKVTEFDPNCPKFVKTTEFATKFFQLLDETLTVTTTHDDHEFVIHVAGDDVSRLIGKNGHTLAAINTLINSIAVNTHSGEPRRVLVDIGDYRERRRESLINLAQRKAEYVKKSGHAVKLEPMPARERVIVHMALQDVEGIITQSEGVEPHRYLVIKPGAR